jgi:UDP-N-acetylglucosamine 2-epimerase (non-hydrolysing)
MKTCFIIGTRPEIIKLSSLIREFVNKNENFFIIHTNQHYSEKLDKIFFEELALPIPKYNLNVGSGAHGYQTGTMMIRIEEVLIKEKPKLVVVEGDTNTVLAGALAASKLHIKVAHVEAGLRSYFRQMPEEINRVVVDHISDFLLAPTLKSQKILIREGINKNKICVTGNTIVDAVYQNLKLSKQNNILQKLKLLPKEYFLLTAHREENVDNKEILLSIFSAMEAIARQSCSPIIYPIHPRTKKKIAEFMIKVPKEVIIIEPLGYLDFLSLENNARLIFTDSGGVQEESCILKVPCITLRDNTERPETIDVGANMLAGTGTSKIIEVFNIMIKKGTNWNNPFGNGKAYQKISNYINNE